MDEAKRSDLEQLLFTNLQTAQVCHTVSNQVFLFDLILPYLDNMSTDSLVTSNHTILRKADHTYHTYLKELKEVEEALLRNGKEMKEIEGEIERKRRKVTLLAKKIKDKSRSYRSS